MLHEISRARGTKIPLLRDFSTSMASAADRNGFDAMVRSIVRKTCIVQLQRCFVCAVKSTVASYALHQIEQPGDGL